MNSTIYNAESVFENTEIFKIPEKLKLSQILKTGIHKYQAKFIIKTTQERAILYMPAFDELKRAQITKSKTVLVNDEFQTITTHKHQKYLYFITDGKCYGGKEYSDSATVAKCLIDFDYNYELGIVINKGSKNTQIIPVKLDIYAFLYKIRTNDKGKYVGLAPEFALMNTPQIFDKKYKFIKGSVLANGLDLVFDSDMYNNITLEPGTSKIITVGKFDEEYTKKYLKNNRIWNNHGSYYIKNNIFNDKRWCLRSRYATQGLQLQLHDLQQNTIVFKIFNRGARPVHINDEPFLQYIPFNTEQIAFFKHFKIFTSDFIPEITDKFIEYSKINCKENEIEIKQEQRKKKFNF